ncbi:MAG: PEP-CTERM sorting domain-containing protein [Deltaproteobacteria bacterium]|nr:PEP-CTERM sorting domain-containing protein [Deltaproteobacteria bacterium]
MKKKLVAGYAIGFMILIVAGIAQAAIVQWATNGHYYDAIAFPSGITWNDAKTFAENSTYLGMNGHLATVTSVNENSFIVNNLGGPSAVNRFLLGGFQPAGSPEPGGNWQWVTGETWSFTNWDPSEPNNAYSGGAIFNSQATSTSEEVLHFYHNAGQWNDVPLMSGWGGLIVEYEPSPVPLPSSMLLFGSGLVGLIGYIRFCRSHVRHTF